MKANPKAKPLVIIGTGLAGYNLAREWRKLNPTTELIMITEDTGRSYSKPMLSTGFAKNKSDQDLAMADAGKMAMQLNATILTHQSVRAIDRKNKEVILDNQSIIYSQLVLATGSNAIELPIANSAVDRTFSVNNLEQYAAFREAALKAHHIVIIGGGLIGCEYANDLSHTEAKITLIELKDQLLQGLAPQEVSQYLSQELAKKNVDIHLNCSAQSITKGDTGVSVSLSTGKVLSADLILSAVGVKANVALAEEANLDVGQGIIVDRELRTSDPSIFALGDCATVNGFTLFYVMPLMQCVRALSKTLIGQPTQVAYPAMPVAIKTSCCPIVTNPPNEQDATWDVTQLNDGVRALARKNDQLVGFSLCGPTAIKEKAQLAKQLPEIFI